MIGQSVLVGARDKVDPRCESYAWVPETGSFDKLREVGVFSYSVYFRSKSHSNGTRCLGAENDCAVWSQNFGTKCRNFLDYFGQSHD